MGKFRLNNWKDLLRDDEATPDNSLLNKQSLDHFKAPSTPHQTLRHLQSGKIPPQETLNLRGMKLIEAQKEIDALFKRTSRQTCYLIIHGKGNRSENMQPKIKNLLHATLTDHPQVSAYCKALPHDGGQGAMYLLILAPPRR